MILGTLITLLNLVAHYRGMEKLTPQAEGSKTLFATVAYILIMSFGATAVGCAPMEVPGYNAAGVSNGYIVSMSTGPSGVGRTGLDGSHGAHLAAAIRALRAAAALRGVGAGERFVARSALQFQARQRRDSRAIPPRVCAVEFRPFGHNCDGRLSDHELGFDR